MPPGDTDAQLVQEAVASGLLNPYASFSFIVDFGFASEGKTLAGFSEVDGLVQTIKMLEVEECTDPFRASSIPIGFRFSNIVLKRGKTANNALLTWWRQATGVIRVADSRRSGQIHLIHPQTTSIVATWSVKNAFPVRYEQSGFNAMQTGLAVEAMELVHEGVQEVDAGKAR